MANSSETDRLFRRLSELFDEDNAPYRANEDGSTTVPREKLMAWIAALLKMAVVCVLKLSIPQLPRDRVVSTTTTLAGEGIRAMVAKAKTLQE